MALKSLTDSQGSLDLYPSHFGKKLNALTVSTCESINHQTPIDEQYSKNCIIFVLGEFGSLGWGWLGKKSQKVTFTGLGVPMGVGVGEAVLLK